MEKFQAKDTGPLLHTWKENEIEKQDVQINHYVHA